MLPIFEKMRAFVELAETAEKLLTIPSEDSEAYVRALTHRANEYEKNMEAL